MNRSELFAATPLANEAALVDHVADFLRKRGYRVRLEVPNMGQSMDIAATKGRWLTAVEAKMRDWRRALDQCLAHEHVADYICVAIGAPAVPSDFMAQCSKRGYGIIHYRNDANACALVQAPARNRNVWIAQRRCLARHLRGISHVQ